MKLTQTHTRKEGAPTTWTLDICRTMTFRALLEKLWAIILPALGVQLIRIDIAGIFSEW